MVRQKRELVGLSGLGARGAGTYPWAGLISGSCCHSSWTGHEMQLPVLLVVVISSIRVNIFIYRQKITLLFFSVLQEKHYWKPISSVLIWMVFATWVPWRRWDTCTMSGGCCPTEPVEGRKRFFSRSNTLISMPFRPQQQKFQSSMVMLSSLSPPRRLPTALPKCCRILPTLSALDWTMSCWTLKHAFWWVHRVMFCLLLLYLEFICLGVSHRWLQ